MLTLTLICATPRCQAGVQIELIQLDPAVIARELQGWTQDSEDPDLYYCQKCSAENPSVES
jgi:hypothetical protein